MPNAYPNKIQVMRGGQTETLIDLTADTITASALMQGYTAHDASGAPITGTATGGSMVIRDEADSHGGTIRHITAGTVVTGTTSITENGSYDVAQYADAVVSVPAPAPSLQSKTATPTESQQTVTPDQGYDGLSSVSVGAISSTYVGSGITRRDSSSLSASGATVTVPSGYYAAQASKAVASGTAGTPTASKGTVSNHSVSVTPSVTNTAGYISGGTKTGTAVSVSASELVSGTYTVGASGTHDVTNYASASVASGGATASATKGTVSNHSVTVTPTATRTAGYVTAGSSNGTAVTVSASELVSGTLSITENGTADVTNYASVSVAVSGGATNIVVGTLEYDSAGIKTVAIPYTGNGYPVLIDLCVTNVENNTDWQDYVGRYKVEHLTLSKIWPWTAPSYAGTSNQDYTLGVAKYKSSTSDATVYSFSNGTRGTYGSTASHLYSTGFLTMLDSTTMKIAVAYSNYSIPMNINYTYRIVYSE